MEAHLAERGAARGTADTPDELLRRAIDQGIVRGSAGRDSPARRLTAAFYEARFSTHEVGQGARDAAIAALDGLTAELADAVAGAAS